MPPTIRLPALTLLLALVAAPAFAQPVPRRAYSISDGLAHDLVNRIRIDSRGFVWFATYSGLSRFDRTQFVTYRTAEGLPDLVVNDIFEDRQGRLWIPTNGGGVARILPHDRMAADGRMQSGRVADSRAANRVNVMQQDADGTLWAGTDDGLFRMVDADAITFALAPLTLAGTPDHLLQIFDIAAAPNGDLWLATREGLVHRTRDGHTTLYRVRDLDDRREMLALALDSRGLVWAGGRAGLLVFRADAPAGDAVRVVAAARCTATGGTPPAPPGTDQVCRVELGDDPALEMIRAVHLLVDGTVLIGTNLGVLTLRGDRLTTLVRVVDAEAYWATPDVDGSVWVGTSMIGAMHLVANGFSSINRDDGLADNYARRLFLDHRARVNVNGQRWVVSLLDGSAIRTGRFALPGVAPSPWQNSAHRDRRGEWWVVTGDGLFRFPSVEVEQLARTAPIAVYKQGTGLPSGAIATVYEDSRGDIWVALNGPGEEVARWDHATQRFQTFGTGDGLPGFGQPVCFAEDRSGQIWVGFREGGMARYAGGRFRTFGTADGVVGQVRTLYGDRSGRLWVGMQFGAGRVDDPTAATLKIRRYTTEDGLSSNEVYSFTSDAIGRLYIGTERGVDRLDPQSGAVTNFGPDDGLVAARAHSSITDPQGRLWFGTSRGVAHFTPGPELTPPPPRVLISGLRIAGTPVPVSPLGAQTIADLPLPPGRNLLEIAYLGPGYRTGERLRFEYRVGEGDWQGPTSERAVTLAQLPFGDHRFEVRAVNSQGMRSPQPAVITFTVLAPVWARWWFIIGALSTTGLLIYGLYRYRVGQLLHVERVRARIATDLHDDIGASLTQIAILAEVLKQASAGDPAVGGPLNRIAQISRQLVEGMSDIVWAINPKRDSLKDLIHRMRRFAEDTLGGSNIAMTFNAPEPARDRKVGADLRRDVLLILKESITNIARHSEATEARVDLTVDAHRIVLRVSDNGRGFALDEPTDGNGLDSMRKRIAAFGGTLEITSAPGQGTTVHLTVSLSATRHSTTYLRSGGSVGPS